MPQMACLTVWDSNYYSDSVLLALERALDSRISFAVDQIVKVTNSKLPAKAAIPDPLVGSFSSLPLSTEVKNI